MCLNFEIWYSYASNISAEESFFRPFLLCLVILAFEAKLIEAFYFQVKKTVPRNVKISCRAAVWFIWLILSDLQRICPKSLVATDSYLVPSSSTNRTTALAFGFALNWSTILSNSSRLADLMKLNKILSRDHSLMHTCRCRTATNMVRKAQILLIFLAFLR